jgi:hypothetical protein
MLGAGKKTTLKVMRLLTKTQRLKHSESKGLGRLRYAPECCVDV